MGKYSFEKLINKKWQQIDIKNSAGRRRLMKSIREDKTLTEGTFKVRKLDN